MGRLTAPNARGALSPGLDAVTALALVRKRASVVACTALLACSSDGGTSLDAGGDSAVSDDAPRADAAQPGDGGAPGDAGLLPPGYVPAFDSLDLRCKLISDSNIDDPTPNNTHYRANLRGTDLGIPVAHGDDLFFFFGDSAGAQNIWPLGTESLPDAVGYAAVTNTEVAADPSVLCSKLRFLVTGAASGDVESDFAGAHMNPPPGHDISEFIHNPAGPRGANMFPNLPGDFEVPSGAFSHSGSIYLFYTIINQDPFEMRGSYLAMWSAPATDSLPNYQILYHVDERFDEDGALRGDFINIAPLIVGDYVYLYGTGQYRASPVHLARKALADLATEGGFESFDATSGTWGAADAPAAPVVPEPNLGEVSVRYFPAIDRYVMLDQEINVGNRIAARFAEAPEGPWSDPITVATMSDPSFAAHYCCAGTDCSGERLFECEHAGFYGTYMLPTATVHGDGSFSIDFLMSTWIPYNVALMTATFR